MANSADGDDRDRIAFTEQMSTRISHVLDDPDDLWVEWQVTSNPTTIFVAADGTSERVSRGLSPQALVERLEELAAA